MNANTKLQEATSTLEYIAGLAGNLPDERLESRTGPNDAVARGILVVAARAAAKATLAKIAAESPDRTPLEKAYDDVSDLLETEDYDTEELLDRVADLLGYLRTSGAVRTRIPNS